jgi:putative DNA primase/helicase
MLAASVWNIEPLEAAKRIAGDSPYVPQAPRPASRGRPPAAKPVALPAEIAMGNAEKNVKAVYSKSRILEIAKMMKNPIAQAGQIAAVWWYKNEKGDVDGLDVRFELAREKIVITYWYDGTTVRTSPAPVLIYGRDQLIARPDTTICIHEGAKCAEAAAKALPDFVHIAWSGGAQKAGKADWGCLRGREVIIYPDADAPGSSAAYAIRERLQGLAKSFYIRAPLPAAVARFGPGSDIVEAMQVASPEELGEYLAHGPELEVKDGPRKEDQSRNPSSIDDTLPGKPEKDRTPTSRPDAKVLAGRDKSEDGNTDNGCPFRILGVADDGLAYFLDQWGRLQKWRLEQTNQDKLRLLAPFIWWFTRYQSDEGKMGKPQWMQAIEDLIQRTGAKDFDPDSTRGRGAWRNKEGEMCYFDGMDFLGANDPHHYYIRRVKKDIGLSDTPATLETRKEMLLSACDLSFETRADAIRALSWSVLAPFCGALPWRPTGFITGKSGSGKTTALNYIIKPLSGAEGCTGAASTEAGIRQHNKVDAIGIIVDELEDDTPDKKENRDRIIGYERQCTSDDVFPGWKGTQDGAGMKFGSEKMFLNIAISPVIDSSADANRMFSINMVLDEDEAAWSKKEARVKAAFCEENCRAVRAYTWVHLAEIIDYAKTMRSLVHRESNHTTRYSFLEAILFSAYWIVFQGRIPDEDEAKEFLVKRYAEHAPERPEDECETMLAHILDEVVQIDGDYKTRETLRNVLSAIKFKDGGIQALDVSTMQRYKKTANLWGLHVNKTGEIIIKNGYRPLMKILGSGKDYHKMLMRHPSFDRTIANQRDYQGGQLGACTVFKGEIIAVDELPF